jgi:hypothetical protein
VTRKGILLAIVALAFVVAACSVGAHWVGDGIEAVDGFWIMQERACDDPGCTAAKGAALVAIGDPEGSTVSKASQADWTEAYDSGIGGGLIMRTKSPPVGITFVVVLDLKDGTRQVVPISCSQQDGVAPAAMWDHCGQDGMDHAYNQVGNEPWTQPGPNSL